MSEQPEQLSQLRARANSVLQNMMDIPNIDTSSVDDLIHELQVHQVELELQNQELHIAQGELQISEEKYKNLFDFMPLAYLTLNEQRVILKANPAAGRQFACDIRELEGSRFEKFVSPEFRDTFYLGFRKLHQGEIKELDTIEFIRQDETRFYGFIENKVNDSSGQHPVTHITISDISQRLSYLSRLKGSRELDQAILMIPNITKILALALKQLLKLTHCSDARILFFHPDTLSIYEFSQNQDDTEMRVDVESKSEASNSLPPDEAHIIHELESKIPESDDLLKIPIFQSEMHIGYLGLTEATERSFTEEIIEIAQDIARQLGVAIQHVRLLEKVTHHAQELEIRVDKRTRELHASEQMEHVQRVFAEAMLDMTRSLNSTLDLDQVLQRVLVNLENVIGYDTAEIILLENNTTRLARRGGKYLDTNNLNLDVHTIPAYKHMLETGEKLWVDDLEAITAWGLSGLLESAKAYLGVPLYYENRALGILNIYIRQSTPFSPLKMQYLEVFTEQAALAIKNAHQHQQAQQLAVLEERQRLARDLHDSVSQMLFSLTSLSETLGNKTDENSDILQHIVNLARGAQAEMRLLLFELNPTNFEDRHLGYLLEKLVQGFKGHTQRHIEVNLHKESLSLPVDVKLHLFRIAQEALHNILKHTSRGVVMLHLQKHDNCVRLLIEDKGEGFDSQGIEQKGRGLSNMRERAEEIGADYTISSTIGSGTQVKVTLNLAD